MRALLILAVMVFAMTTTAAAITYVVNPQGTGDFPTIQAAIAGVLDGDIIQLTDGTFTGAGNRDIDFAGKAITVESQSGNPETCIIDCQGGPTTPHRAFLFQSGEGNSSVLSGVTIRNGLHTDPGGGIYCNGASPTITGCILTDNVSYDQGGGLYCQNCAPVLTSCIFVTNGHPSSMAGAGMTCLTASPTLTDCDFHGNQSQSGGGLFCGSNSSPSLTNCEFLENVATAPNGYGGGMFCYYFSSPTLTDCTFSGNSGDLGGAAAFNDHCDPTLTNCSFTDNTSANGGGTYWLYLCMPTLEYCTFWNNSATNYGGAVWCSASSPALVNCTLAGNSAGTDGGGVHLYQSSPTLDNTIIAFSTSGAAVYCYAAGSLPVLNCCDVYGNAGGNWVGCIAGQAGISGNIGMDPLFCNAAIGNFRLQDNSPCAAFSPPNQQCDLIGAWPAGCASPVSEETPSHASMPMMSVPNPFMPSAQITYVIPSWVGISHVHLSVYDVDGRLVRTLVDAAQAPGVRSISWNGASDAGTDVPAGVYFGRLSTGGEPLTMRILLIR